MCFLSCTMFPTTDVVSIKIFLHLVLWVQIYTKTMNNTIFWLYFCCLTKKELLLYVFLPKFLPSAHFSWFRSRLRVFALS